MGVDGPEESDAVGGEEDSASEWSWKVGVVREEREFLRALGVAILIAGGGAGAGRTSAILARAGSTEPLII